MTCWRLCDNHKTCEILVYILESLEWRDHSHISIRANNNDSASGVDAIGGIASSSNSTEHVAVVNENPRSIYQYGKDQIL